MRASEKSFGGPRSGIALRSSLLHARGRHWSTFERILLDRHLLSWTNACSAEGAIQYLRDISLTDEQND